MGGLSYYAVMDQVHQALYPRTYLEIGVFQGYGLALALPGTRVVGVDPSPRIVAPLPRNAVIARMTSDDFFASGRLPHHLDGLPLDLAFIDGMHLWEYSLRDFLNVERASAPGSMILVHDCLPHSAEMAGRVESKGWWTGDVWKLFYFMRQELPDLDVTVIDAAATGLALIRGLNPRRPEIDRDAAIARYMGLDFGDFEADLLPSLRIVGTDALSQVLIQQPPWQATDRIADLVAMRSLRRPRATARARALGLKLMHSAPARAVLRARRKILGESRSAASRTKR